MLVTAHVDYIRTAHADGTPDVRARFLWYGAEFRVPHRALADWFAHVAVETLASCHYVNGVGHLTESPGQRRQDGENSPHSKREKAQQL